MLKVNQHPIETDKEGYLRNLGDWSPDVAQAIAQREDIELTPEHWEIIEVLRRFYQAYDHSPAMRALTKFVKEQLGEFKGRSIYLSQLFPKNVAKQACKIAGLPKPTGCL